MEGKQGIDLGGGRRVGRRGLSLVVWVALTGMTAGKPGLSP